MQSDRREGDIVRAFGEFCCPQAGVFAEHDQVQQRVGPQAVGAMHRDAGHFPGGVQPGKTVFLSSTTTSPNLLVGMPPMV
jgi:hypothetical protein